MIHRMAARGARVSMVDPRERRPCLKELEVIYAEQVRSLAGKRFTIGQLIFGVSNIMHLAWIYAWIFGVSNACN